MAKRRTRKKVEEVVVNDSIKTADEVKVEEVPSTPEAFIEVENVEKEVVQPDGLVEEPKAPEAPEKPKVKKYRAGVTTVV